MNVSNKIFNRDQIFFIEALTLEFKVIKGLAYFLMIDFRKFCHEYTEYNKDSEFHLLIT